MCQNHNLWDTLESSSHPDTIMVFEFDPDKSQANLEKHGIDFEQA